MKTKKKVLIGLMALCLAGSVGGVLALTSNAATQSGTTGAFDQAVYLYWTTDSSTLTLSDVNDLTAGTPKYRYLTVAPKSTKSVSGNVTLTFTLASGGANTHMEGLSIAVYKTESLATDGTVASLIDGVTAAPTLNKTTLSGTTSFAVTTSSTAHETKAYYAIEVIWTGSNDASHPTYALGANLTIAQSFSA